MDGWWDEVEAVVRDALEHGDEVSAVDIAQRLGVSEAAASSLLGTLASCGSLRILSIGGPIKR